MAEEKDELGNELMGQDFLGDMQDNINKNKRVLKLAVEEGILF